MKRVIGLLVLLSVLGIIYGFNQKKGLTVVQKTFPIPSISAFPRVSTKKEIKSIFVPYWSVDAKLDIENYERVLYFGVSPGPTGLNKNENGYRVFEKFVAQKKFSKQYVLTLRMLEEGVNELILQNPSLQENLIKETIQLAKQNSFSGVALDLELTGLFQTTLTNQMNEFVQRFYSEAKKEQIQFIYIIYGDVFFRKRPYDIGFVSKHSDEVMVMAYDYHKSRGEPGPNFPFNHGNFYDYDLKLMVDEFLQFVPAEKLTIIFGMYGYDWLVDEQKRPIRPGKALSYAEIKKKFIDSCQWKNCIIKRDDISAETEINYIDEFQNYHIVWFEDSQSVETKKKYLNEKGIYSISFWSYDYF